MADFNTKIKDADTGSSLVGASQGIKAPVAKVTATKATTLVDTSASANTRAGMVQDAGSLFGSAVTVVDQGIKRDIENTARQEGDTIFSEFGVGDQATLEQTITNEPPPKDINKVAQNLARLQNAYDRGVISENSYAARFESVSRQLRARYPGHRDYIDNQISKISGINPANTLIRNMMSQAASGKDAAVQEERRRLSYLEEVTKAGVGVGFIPGIEQMSYMDMLKATGPAYAEKNKITVLKSQAEAMKAQGEVATEKYKEAARRDINILTTKTFQDVTSPFGKNYQELTTNIKAAMQDNKVSTEEAAALRAQLGNFKNGFMAAVTKTTLANYGNELSEKDREDVMSPAVTFIKRIEDALLNPQTGDLLRMSHEMEYMKTSDDLDFVKSDSNVAMAATARRVLGDDASKLFIEYSAQIKADRDKLLFDHANDTIFGTNTGVSLQAAINQASARGSTDPTLKQNLLRSSLDVIKSRSTSPEAKQKAATALFGVRNSSFLEESVTETQQGQVFSAMVNTETLKALKEMEAAGNPDGLARFKSWTKSSFAPIFRSTADTIRQNTEGMSSSLIFNEKTGQIEVPSNLEGAAGGRGGTNPEARENQRLSGIRAPVDKLNSGLRALKVVLDDEGIEMKEYLGAYYPSLLKMTKTPPMMKLGGPGEGLRGGQTETAVRIQPGETTERGTQVLPEVGDSTELSEIDALIKERRDVLNTFNDPLREVSIEEADEIEKSFVELTKLLEQKRSIENAWIEEFKRRAPKPVSRKGPK